MPQQCIRAQTSVWRPHGTDAVAAAMCSSRGSYSNSASSGFDMTDTQRRRSPDASSYRPMAHLVSGHRLLCKGQSSCMIGLRPYAAFAMMLADLVAVRIGQRQPRERCVESYIMSDDAGTSPLNRSANAERKQAYQWVCVIIQNRSYDLQLHYRDVHQRHRGGCHALLSWRHIPHWQPESLQVGTSRSSFLSLTFGAVLHSCE